MGKYSNKEILGTRQGIYDVIYECDFKSNDGHRMFHVKCSKCGWETNIQMHQIKYTKICQHLDMFGNYIIKYNWVHQELHSIFQIMKQRCYNPNRKDYRWYGEKGIKICEEWLNSPSSFEKWSENNGWKPGLTIDRIDGNKNYCPENCRWVSKSFNSKYKSTTRIIEVNRVCKTGREWASTLNIGTNVINSMLRNNPEELVKQFIVKRMKDPTKKIEHGSWFKTYNINTK